jgi:hypothetical protein
MPMDPEKGFRKIAILENLIEAQVLEDLLGQDGIPHRIVSFHDTAYDGLFQFQRGWGAVYALPWHREILLELLQRIREDRSAQDASSETT